MSLALGLLKGSLMRLDNASTVNSTVSVVLSS